MEITGIFFASAQNRAESETGRISGLDLVTKRGTVIAVREYLSRVADGRLASLSAPASGTQHSTRAVTHPGMLEYFPVAEELLEHRPHMEANLLFVTFAELPLAMAIV